MSLTCPNMPETIAVAVGKVIQPNTPAQLIAAFPGNTKTPTANFAAHINGHTLAYTKGVPFVTTPALLAALTAQNAPIV